MTCDSSPALQRSLCHRRRSNLRLLTGASGGDLTRVGVHAERGEESLEHMIGLYAGHDLLHLGLSPGLHAVSAIEPMC